MQIEHHALVVEDDAAIRSLVVTILRRAGFVVDEARDGAEAIDCLSHDPGYEIILLDITMPHVSGVEVIEEIKRRSPQTLRKIIIITATTSVLQHGLPDHVCRVITKPFDVQFLLEAVNECATA